MKKDVTLYNVMFPIWFLLVFPVAWIVVLPANFIIDSIVLLISAKLLKLTNIKEIYKKTILKVWLIGFASDFVGAGILFIGSSVEVADWNEYLYSLSWNPFDNWYALLYAAFAVAVTGVLIYIANIKFSFHSLEIDKRKKRILALALAIFTAPYVFLYPSSLINGGTWDELDFMTNHIVKRDEFRLEVDIAQEPSESHVEKSIVMYYYGQEMKVAINEAQKISDDNAINSKPDYTLNFYNRDYTGKRTIPIWIDGKQGYFEYENAWYEMDEKTIEPFINGVQEVKNTMGKREFTITPDPKTFQVSEERAKEIDKDGKGYSDYPVFEDSRYLYYCDKRDLYDSAMIEFEDGEKTDIYTALESGLVTPQGLIEHGFNLTVEPRE